MEQSPFLKALCSIMLVLIFAGCGSNPDVTTPPAAPAVSGAVSLDEMIAQAARRMEERLPGGTKIAIVSVASPSTAFSSYVIDSLEAALVDSGALKVVDRANLDKIRAEQGFQLSGDVSDESAKSIGQMLGAGAIVTGSLLNIGDEYRLTLKAINIENAEVAVSYPADIANDRRVQALLASGGGTSGASYPQGSTAVSAVQAAPSVAPTASPAPTYKVGDTGPAGGLIFYDKGNNSGGWRYLEAASQDVGIGVPWAASMRIVSGTSTVIGTGKQNSDLIRGSLEESVAAALVALHYSQGGYSDWYLPSKDELNLMCQNLKQKNLGSLNGWYWSSSDAASSIPDNDAWSLNFSNGEWNGTSNGDNKGDLDTSVRPIRQF